MGRNSGGGGGSAGGGGVSAAQREKYNKLSAVKAIKDKDVRAEVVEALAMMENETGKEFTNIGISKGMYEKTGSAAHYDPGKDKIIIDSDYTKNSKYWGKAAAKLGEQGEIVKVKSGNEQKYMLTHELAHAHFTNYHQITQKTNRAGYSAAAKEIGEVYKSFLSDKSSAATSMGRYARKNMNEFYAEAMTKHILGTPNSYTRKVKAIAKKYNL